MKLNSTSLRCVASLFVMLSLALQAMAADFLESAVDTSQWHETTLKGVVLNYEYEDQVFITDNTLTCVYATDKYLFAKDDNCSWVDSPAQGEIDYNGIVGLGDHSSYDHSYWIKIVLPKSSKATAEENRAKYVGKRLTNVYGMLSSWWESAPVIDSQEVPGVGETNSEYKISPIVCDTTDNINTYIPCNFSQKRPIVSPVNGKSYFFSIPREWEVADITWAQWKTDPPEEFVPITPDGGTVNRYKLTSGSFYIDLSMNEGSLKKTSDLQVGKVYQFRAIIRFDSYSIPHAKPISRRKMGGDPGTDGLYVYPLNLSVDPYTSISPVLVQREVQSVCYYNLAGMCSEQPFTGLNVVVTTYTDGSRAITKVVK